MKGRFYLHCSLTPPLIVGTYVHVSRSFSFSQDKRIRSIKHIGSGADPDAPLFLSTT